jgi:hypothetical protein
MLGKLFIVGSLAVGLTTPALAAEYLTEVTSEVYQISGTPREIATRANTCISQHLAPGTTDSQLIINSDLEGGVIVARNALRYPDGLMQWQVRSTFTFEARDGRFRIAQTNLERLNDRAGGWGPIGKWTGSGWRRAEQAFSSSASVVARCVMQQPAADDW